LLLLEVEVPKETLGRDGRMEELMMNGDIDGQQARERQTQELQRILDFLSSSWKDARRHDSMAVEVAMEKHDFAAVAVDEHLWVLPILTAVRKMEPLPPHLLYSFLRMHLLWKEIPCVHSCCRQGTPWSIPYRFLLLLPSQIVLEESSPS
jgi:hypothetical protein